MADLVLNHKPSLDQIFAFEKALSAHPGQIELNVSHYFADGLYAREIFIPAGTALTGKIHKGEHLNIISKGRIAVWTEDGMQEISAPFTMVSFPGTKRVGYAIEDTVWTTIHHTKIEAVFPDPETLKALELELIEEAPLCLG